MSAAAAAATITIVPSDLGEHEFFGPDLYARSIEVDMVAGTMTVAARGQINPNAFDWSVPNVPLSALMPLVEALLPHVRRALPGVSSRQARPHEWPLALNEAAEEELSAADDLVDTFYRRWTGRAMPSLRCSKCVKCEATILQGINQFDGRWVESAGETPGCDHGSEHEPYPSGHPHAPRRHIPEHLLSLTQNSASGWSGMCGCGEWRHDGPTADWKSIAVGHYLHAEAIPPGAPFDTGEDSTH